MRKGVDRVRTGDADDGEIDRRGIERDRLIPPAAGVDENSLPADLDKEGKRLAEDPVVDFARRQMGRRAFERRDAKDAVVDCRENTDVRAFHSNRCTGSGAARFVCWNAGGLGEPNAGRRRNQLRAGRAQNWRNVVKMVDVAMRYEHGVDLGMLARPLIDEVRFADWLEFQRG